MPGQRGPRRETIIRRESDLLELADYLDARGARNGVDLKQREIRDALGWTRRRLQLTMNWAHEHPENGIAVHVQRGAHRLVVLTYDGATLHTTPSVTDMAVREGHENFRRIIRSTAKALVRLRQSDQRYLQTRNLSWQLNLYEQTLRNAAFAMQAQDEEAYAREIELIERVLA